MADPPARAWSALREWFSSNAAEWGGTRLLLRVIPGPHGHVTGVPPFAPESVRFEGSLPGHYPWLVLKWIASRTPLGTPTSRNAVVCEDKWSLGMARFGLYWFHSNAGWNQWLDKAAEAGRLLGTLPEDCRKHLWSPPEYQVATEDDARRWMLALFALGTRGRGEGTLTARPAIVDHRHRWLTIPVNRAERARLIRDNPGYVADALRRDTYDDLAAVLTPEVYAASALACAAIEELFPRRGRPAVIGAERAAVSLDECADILDHIAEAIPLVRRSITPTAESASSPSSPRSARALRQCLTPPQKAPST